MPEIGDRFLHLPVRTHTHFSRIRTVKASHVNREDLAWAKKKYGIKRLPRGTKVRVGRLKKRYRKEGPKGKRVARYKWAIVSILLLKGSKEAKRLIKKMGLK